MSPQTRKGQAPRVFKERGGWCVAHEGAHELSLLFAHVEFFLACFRSLHLLICHPCS